MNWPVGNADEFRGVYDIQRQTLHLYEREAQGQYRAPVDISALDDPEARERDRRAASTRISASRSMSSASAGTQFDVDEYLAGLQTPVFFGSALTNFGLEPFLQALVELAPPPRPRPSDSGIVSPTDERFTGFVFKIQANMDPRHRDRVAFVRVCSGRFEKDMVLSNSRVGKPLRASRAYRFFGRDRETIDVAYAGDILGLVNPGPVRDRRHGPHRRSRCKFLGVPRFPAEHFGRVRLKDTRYKQFDEGLKQLEEEGLMQVFYTAAGRREPIVGVVGQLQLDVITQPAAQRVQRRGRHRACHLHGRAMAGRSARRSSRWAGRAPSPPIASSGRSSCSARSGSSSTSRASTRTSSCSPNRRRRLIAADMISFSKINKQYGKQVLFVDASFQLNEGEKVGLVGPERLRQDDAVPDDRRRGAARTRARCRFRGR